MVHHRLALRRIKTKPNRVARIGRGTRRNPQLRKASKNRVRAARAKRGTVLQAARGEKGRQVPRESKLRGEEGQREALKGRATQGRLGMGWGWMGLLLMRRRKSEGRN